MEIDDEDVLYRRLARHQVNPDGTVNSSAFKRGAVFDTEMSVDISRLTTPQESVDRAGRAGFRLGSVQAKHPRTLGFDVEADPMPDNPSHALIKGKNDQATSRSLARNVQIVVGVESRQAH